jgi:hypothetical protein
MSRFAQKGFATMQGSRSVVCIFSIVNNFEFNGQLAYYKKLKTNS